MKFDQYEYTGVILPGSVVVLAASLLYPEVKELLGKDGISLGGLGVFVVASFVVGHVLQAFGNLIEWLGGGVYGQGRSGLLLSPTQSLIGPSQRDRLKSAVVERCGADLDRLSKPEWAAVRREMYADIHAAKRSDRIDAFNRTYGLHRGLAAGFLVAAGLTTVSGTAARWYVVAVLLAAAVLALYRMRRFSDHYARELVVEYLRGAHVTPAAGAKPTPHERA